MRIRASALLRHFDEEAGFIGVSEEECSPLVRTWFGRRIGASAHVLAEDVAPEEKVIPFERMRVDTLSVMTNIVTPDDPGRLQPEAAGVSTDLGPRASWIAAALLSLVAPGLGHIYARRTRRGLAWALSPLALSLLGMASTRLRGPVVLLPLLVVAIHIVVLRLAAAADAVWVVRHRASSRLSLLGTALATLAIIAFSEGYGAVVKRSVIEAFARSSRPSRSRQAR